MKLASSLIVAGCLAALTPAARAQDTYTFESHLQNQFLANGSTVTAETNPARSFVFNVTNTANDPQFLPNQAFEFVSNLDGSNHNVNYGTNLDSIVLLNADSLPNDVVKLTFNQPITTLSFDFVIISGASTVPMNSLQLTLDGTTMTGMGSYVAASTNFEGNLSAAALNPTKTAFLSYQANNGRDFGYAIDHLTVNPSAASVPEPGVVALALAGLTPVAGLLRRQRAR